MLVTTGTKVKLRGVASCPGNLPLTLLSRDTNRVTTMEEVLGSGHDIRSIRVQHQ